MSQFYSPKRTRNLYDPKSGEPYRLSRSKIELFLECPRCFYLDRRLGVNRPKGPPFTLNSAVDALLKKEFDIYRDRGEKHPIMEEHGIDAIPVSHPKLDEWRENFVGVQYHHQPTNLTITGAIDDLWQDSQGEYIVAEYKATSKDKVITELDEEWQDSYKRQMELYQWLIRKNELRIAIIYLDRVTQQFPNWKEPYEVKATALGLENQPEAMREALKRACELGSSNACAEINKGMVNLSP